MFNFFIFMDLEKFSTIFVHKDKNWLCSLICLEVVQAYEGAHS